MKYRFETITGKSVEIDEDPQNKVFSIKEKLAEHFFL